MRRMVNQLMADARRLVDKLRSYCNVLRDESLEDDPSTSSSGMACSARLRPVACAAP